MEKELKIKTPDNKYIYGTLRGSLRKPLVVFVHGLTGDRNEHIFFNGARHFQKHGFSSFRFNLYDWQKDARKLHECTLATHAKDFVQVIDFLRKKGAKKIFVAGHSYGGKTILLSVDKDFDGVVLWDPSFGSSAISRELASVKAPAGFVELNETAYGYFLGKEMVSEARKLRTEREIRNLHVPVKIIAAEKGILVRGSKWYFKHANRPKALKIIKGATHCFDEDGTEEKLFNETVGWFKKCLSGKF